LRQVCLTTNWHDGCSTIEPTRNINVKVIRTFISFRLLAIFLLAIASPGKAHETEKSQVHHQSADAIYKELNGIDKNLHREIRQTAGRKRATASLDDLKIKYDLSRKNHQCPIYFGQANAQSRFSGSGKFSRIPLADLAAKLKAGDLTPDDVPIEFIWIDGKKVTLNNRSLTALYKAGKRPTKLIDRTEAPSAQLHEELANTLRRLEGMAGKPSTEMLVRTEGLGPDGQPKEASDWDAPIGEIVSMPEDLLVQARTCEEEAER
jgi:hypothetical protein